MYGGGAAEIACSIAVAAAADEVASIEQYAMRSFATALDAVPLALAENSGLAPIETLADIKSRQVTEGNSRLGVDCAGKGNNGTLSLPRGISPGVLIAPVRLNPALTSPLSRIRRHEGAVCDRPVDQQEAAALARVPARAANPQD